ncbi:Gfo/Idh/MocA family oxidoreductase [Cesiribacter andamanensis]|uniref:Putative oxidoreductase yvaA n=1 Tax=Cesiribacter andamanensis AMV16 TaxID=1279009 RepID=M7NZW1_9BACT|nr:Gfo/Idh/MocA family oxidoreductase [Cesiribacter andamanensis]EMR03899.1 putative oxidoreductase yvaA [Cesiribacter andamanensis AMV16]
MLPIRTLLLGYGLSARAFHVPFLLQNPQYQLVGLVQPRGDSGREAFPTVPHFRRPEEALQALWPELVIICSPNALHAPQARLALEAGAHVVVEKPFALSSGEAEALIALAEAKQRVISVYHNRRWDADFLTLQQVVREGILGRPVQLLSRFDRFRPQIKAGWKEEPAPGSGIFWDLAPHLLDQALLLFGTPQALYAQIRTERTAARTPDAFELFLYYPQVQVQLAAGSLVSASWPRFSLLATKGSYTKGGMDPQEAALRAGLQPGGAEWGSERPDQWGTLLVDNGASVEERCYPSLAGDYGIFYQLLAAAIREGKQHPVPAQEALQVIQLLELAEESDRQGRRLPIASPAAGG